MSVNLLACLEMVFCKAICERNATRIVVASGLLGCCWSSTCCNDEDLGVYWEGREPLK